MFYAILKCIIYFAIGIPVKCKVINQLWSQICPSCTTRILSFSWHLCCRDIRMLLISCTYVCMNAHIRWLWIISLYHRHFSYNNRYKLRSCFPLRGKILDGDSSFLTRSQNQNRVLITPDWRFQPSNGKAECCLIIQIESGVGIVLSQ